MPIREYITHAHIKIVLNTIHAKVQLDNIIQRKRGIGLKITKFIIN